MAKTIFITGATGNLGSAVVDLLHSEGYQLIGTVRPGKSESSEKINLFECDLTSEDSVKTCFEKIQGKYPQIDGAVLLAGGFGMGNLEDSTKADLQKMFDMNFFSAYNTSRLAMQWMKETGGGKLIFTGAKPAIEGGSTAVLPYVLSKNAVIKLAESINESSAKTNVQAAVIVPSIIDTPPNRKAMPDARFDDWVTPKVIAQNISFLLSDQAKVLRGTVLKLYNKA